MEWFSMTDQSILFWIQAHLVMPGITPYMVFITKLGNIGGIWIAIGLALVAMKKYRSTGIAVFIALAISLIVGNGILKHLVERLRPCIEYPWVSLAIATPLPTDYSFPSGHTFGSFAAATAIFFRNRRAGVAALVLAAAIGFSRLYLFVHYPSDVLAGVVFGFLAGWAAYYMGRYVPFIWRKIRSGVIAPVHGSRAVKQ